MLGKTGTAPHAKRKRWEIPHYLYFLANGYDFVKGSRFMSGGGSQDITRLRRLGNRGLLLLMTTLYVAHLTDLCYGFCGVPSPLPHATFGDASPARRREGAGPGGDRYRWGAFAPALVAIFFATTSVAYEWRAIRGHSSA